MPTSCSTFPASSLPGVYLLTSATVTIPATQIPVRKKSLAIPGEAPFPPSFLKPSDEQTVAGVAAVLAAMKKLDRPKEDYCEWGVIAAPRFFGRKAGRDTIEKFESDGAWKVSPLFVAHNSMHALSGTICLALQTHGPNFCAGHALNHLAEGFLSALTFHHTYQPPGTWFVITLCDPEPFHADAGENSQGTVYHGLAMALSNDPSTLSSDCRRLNLTRKENVQSLPRDLRESARAYFDLVSFLESDQSHTTQNNWQHAVNDRFVLQIETPETQPMPLPLSA